MDRDERQGPGRPIEVTRAWVWPVILAVVLTVMVAVNGAFIYIAVTGADEVVESYKEGER